MAGGFWQATLSLLAGLLHLGNVAFDATTTKDGVAASEVAKGSREGLQMAERLLGLTKLEVVLKERSIQSGGRNTVYTKPYSAEEAAHARDALGKRIYERIFRHTVGKINEVLQPSSAAAPSAAAAPTAAAAGGGRWIGLLDVFGFEIFATNGFEQLMVSPAQTLVPCPAPRPQP